MRRGHLEFGFSCIGYLLPAAIGVLLAESDPAVTVLVEYEDFCNTHRPHRTLSQAAPLRPLRE